MIGVARKGDNIKGMTTGEHHGHYVNGIPVHSPCELSGTISNGSNNVFINGQPAAIVGSSTNETDCCGPGSGSITSGSSNVFINGIPLARIGDNISPHNGNAKISSGSSNVFSN